MRVVVAGGTGFLGRALSSALVADNNEVTVLTQARAPEQPPQRAGGVTSVGWKPDGTSSGWPSILVDGADAVVNLAGASIAEGRWTADRKSELRQSRLLATRSLVSAIRAAARPPAVFLSASAIGYYGTRGDELLTEDSPPGTGFLADLCTEWEREAQAAQPATRVAMIRTGIVLDRHGGALARMVPPFLLFAGGPLGSGRQYCSWIHLADWVGLARWILTTGAATGPFNAAAPSPASNAAFSHALGRALHRPSWLRAPAFALCMLLGEMADALLLSSQCVMPARAMELGFRFRFTDLDAALADIFSKAT